MRRRGREPHERQRELPDPLRQPGQPPHRGHLLWQQQLHPCTHSLVEAVPAPLACPTGVSHLASGEPWAVASTVTAIDGRACAGYWVATRSGGVTAIGAAPWLGDLSKHRLNAPIVGVAATADHRGYYLLGADGGIFTFGDARFCGSTGGDHLALPLRPWPSPPTGTATGWSPPTEASSTSVMPPSTAPPATCDSTSRSSGMSADTQTGGYWLVASDGGMLSFHAPFYGSTGGRRLDAPVVGMSPQPDGHGYRLVAADGGVFDFGERDLLRVAPRSRGAQPGRDHHRHLRRRQRLLPHQPLGHHLGLRRRPLPRQRLTSFVR